MCRVQGGGGDVGRRHVIASSGELLGQHTDRTPRLERVPVPRIRQKRQRDRIFSPLVPARLELPGIGRLGVDALEVAVRQSRGQRNTTSPTASRRRTTGGGRTGAPSGPTGSI